MRNRGKHRRSRMGVACALVVGASAVVAAPVPTASAAADDIVINEIMYHPEDDDPNAEFVELFNRGSRAVDISNWCIDGIDYCYRPGTVIGGGRYHVVTSTFWEGRLSNGGEDLQLLDAAGNVVEEFEYDDKEAWPAMADGEGSSLQRLDVSSDPDNPGNWQSHPPTPGAANAKRSAPMPVFSEVEHDVLPAPSAPIAVRAEVDDATGANLLYSIGFGPLVNVRMTLADGEVTGTIPGQPAGTLVRYHLVARSAAGVVGDWPRQGDGALFTGTTVARSDASDLPRFEWFMRDADYEIARNDLTLRGDDGYGAVLAYDGEIFDNTRVRVKGQASRTDPKKKWKFILPAGHELEIDGLLPEGIDEFALHSSWSDKSFVRETLASEAMTAAGVAASQSFPVRLERNGRFFGLYTYLEQQDGTWRDRFDLDDATLYEVGGGRQFGLLSPNDANLSEEALRRKYDKETNEFDDDDDLRNLIRTLNGLRGAAKRNWILANVDVPSVINLLAVGAVIQHQDLGHKNYRLGLSEQGRWFVIPTDFDLTFGRKWAFGCGHLCDLVAVQGAFEHPGGPLFEAFWFDPVFRPMLLRRMRTVADEQLVPSVLNGRVAQLKALVADEAQADRRIWGTYGRSQDPASAADDVIARFVVPQSQRLTGTLARQGRVASPAQMPAPRIAIGTVRYDEGDGVVPYIVLRNDEATHVDISGYRIDELDTVVAGGTVLAPGGLAVLVHEDAESLAGAFACCTFAGLIREDLEDAERGFDLLDRSDEVAASWRLVPPGQFTEMEGRPDSSALVSLVAANTGAGGYLRAVECDDESDGTSNLNFDAPGQTRAGAAVVRFDGDGKACIYNRSATAVIVDVQGYFVETSIDDVPDRRIVDTRRGVKPTRGSTIELSGRPDSSAVVSLVATETDEPGFLEVTDCVAPGGDSSNLNVDAAGQTRSGLAIVRFDATGRACVATSMSTHIVADLQVYLDDAAIDDIADDRVLDTRRGALPSAGSVTEFFGRPGSSALVSLVATQSAAPGYLEVTDCVRAPEQVSNVNIDRPFQTIQNLAVVRFDDAGRACLFTLAASHMLVDIQAYLTDGAFDDIDDERLLDTRLD